MRISDWSSDVCSSDLFLRAANLSLLTNCAGRRFCQLHPEHQRQLRCHNLQFLAGLQVEQQGVVVCDDAPWLQFGWLQSQRAGFAGTERSEEHTSELQSLMRISYAVFCLNKKKHNMQISTRHVENQYRANRAYSQPA